jgi:hypothetical protein
VFKVGTGHKCAAADLRRASRIVWGARGGERVTLAGTEASDARGAGARSYL